MRWPWQTKQELAVPFKPIDVSNDDDNELDIHSGTWRFVKSWAISELESCRKRNDAVNLNSEKTAVLRGEIKTLKRLANLPESITSRDNRLNQSTPPDEAGGDEYERYD